ncbi:MAG TPA: tetratricopeptide repeat protein [Anaeromyxobacteraceae bacterium]|nr:tetratricopeptide repeat protein [Anaeromyxobacteraceae bacterium]
MAIDRKATADKARLLERQGDLDEAIRAWLMIIAECPDDDRAMMMVGHLQEKRGDLPAASIWFERCGDFYAQGGFPQKAAAVYIHAASIDPSALTAGVKGAETLRRLGHPRKAIETLASLAEGFGRRGDTADRFHALCWTLAVACPNGIKLAKA